MSIDFKLLLLIETIYFHLQYLLLQLLNDIFERYCYLIETNVFTYVQLIASRCYKFSYYYFWQKFLKFMTSISANDDFILI